MCVASVVGPGKGSACSDIVVHVGVDCSCDCSAIWIEAVT